MQERYREQVFESRSELDHPSYVFVVNRLGANDAHR